MYPLPGDTVVLLPYESIPVELNLMATDSAQSGAIHIKESLYRKDAKSCTSCIDTCGGFIRNTGGCTVVLELPPTEVNESNYTLYSEIQLHKIVPNPFRKKALIIFDLPTEMFVNLSIYDITGRRVMTLINRKMSCGQHKIEFVPEKAHSLTLGVYFLILKVDNRTYVRKITLIR